MAIFSSLFSKKKSKYPSCRPSLISDFNNNGSTMVTRDFDKPVYQAEEENDEDCDLPEELARLLRQEERVIQPQESIEVINLGTNEEVREVRIGVALEECVKERLINMLKEFSDVFAWSYKDMPGLDTDIVTHKLPLKEDCPPVK